VQVAKIEVQSAGGRNTRAAIAGERPDLQLLAPDWYHGWWNGRPRTAAPFSWQPSLSAGEPDTYRIEFPLTPWGRRQLRATAYRRSLQSLDLALDFAPGPVSADNRKAPQESTGLPGGTFSLRMTSHLPFDLTDCWLVVGATRPAPPSAGSQPAPISAMQGRRIQPPGAASSNSGPADVFVQVKLAPIASGASREDSFDARFQVMQNDRQFIQFEHGVFGIPRVSRVGAVGAWIIGRTGKSPVLTIDRQNSEFVPREETHFFLQEILPEQMPDASLFNATPAAPDKGPSERGTP
jgi:hypothetical protein